MFGLVSGGSIFVAQFWGTKQYDNISRTTALMIICSLIISAFFFTMALFFPYATLRIFSPDKAVINEGIGYLSIISYSFITFGITMTFSFVLRNTENAFVPMIISVISIGLNVFLNWTFIFGRFGIEAMGVRGAGLGTLIARLFELSLTLLVVYTRKYPGMVFFEHFESITKDFLRRFLKYTIPTVANEFFWSTGFTMYSIIYSYMGTRLLAANRIMNSIERLAFALLFALSNAAAVIIGQELGRSDYENARLISSKIITLILIITVFCVTPMFIFAPQFVMLFNVTPEVKELAIFLLRLAMIFVPVKVLNGLFVVGILRAGGDTRFTFFVETGCLWFIGIPATAITGLILNWPFPVVYSMCMVEEVIKLIIVIKRYKSGAWLKNVVESIH